MSSILQENGDYILQENGSKILSEERQDYVFSLAVGAFTLSGITAGVLKGFKIGIQEASFILQGIAIDFRKGFKIIIENGEFVLSGINSTLKKSYLLVLAKAQFALNGSSTGLLVARKLAVDHAEFALTGIATALLKGYALLLSAGSFVLTGIDISYIKISKLIPQVANFSLIGNASTFYIKLGVWMKSRKSDLSWSSINKSSAPIYTDTNKPTTVYSGVSTTGDPGKYYILQENDSKILSEDGSGIWEETIIWGKTIKPATAYDTINKPN